MWRVIAAFLLLLVLAAAAAIKREGFYWIFALFCAFLGIGIFIYLTVIVRKDKEHKTELADIKNAMGQTAFAYGIGSNSNGSDEPKSVPVIETYNISQPGHPADSPQPNEIHVPEVEMPKVETAQIEKIETAPIGQNADGSNKLHSQTEKEYDEIKAGDGDFGQTAPDLAAIIAKIKKDQDDGKAG
ncbi:MAG: hypothetical protein AABX01_01895 [Candidatus Micrarchaeota archaeon]